MNENLCNKKAGEKKKEKEKLFFGPVVSTSNVQPFATEGAISKQIQLCC